MQEKDKIEDFLGKRLENLDSPFQSDWNVFEEKLSNVIYLKRRKRAYQFGAASLFLIFLYVGINLSGRYQQDFYVPRDKSVVLEDISIKDAQNTISSIESSQKEESASIFGQEEENNAAFVSVNASAESPVENEPKTASTAEAIQNNISSNIVQRIAKRLSSSSENGSDINSQTTSISSSEGNYAGQNVAVNGTPNIGAKEKLNTPNQATFASEAKFLDAPESNTPLAINSKSIDEIVDVSSSYLAVQLPPMITEFKVDDEGPYISPLQQESPWSYSINIYPNYTFRTFELDEDKLNYVHADFLDEVEAAESGDISLNFGFELSKRIGAVTYLNTGVEYVSYKTKVVYEFRKFREPNIKSDGTIEGYEAISRTQQRQVNFADKNVYHYINFPLSIAHRPWISEHMRFNIEAGASFMYFAGANGTTLDYRTLEEIDLADRSFRSTMGTLSVSAGLNYFVSKKVNVGFEPTFLYFTNTIYDDEYPFKVIPYSIGLNFNLQFKLN